MYSIHTGPDCSRLSHLIYRLHTCLDHKNKLLLATKIFNFKDEFRDSKEVSKRLLTAVDPEFIYLLLRSSTIFKIIGLELVNLFIFNRDNSTHLRKIIVYIGDILESNWSHKLFECDDSTKIISERIGDPEIVWIRLIYQCLECLDKLSDHLGLEYVCKYNTSVTELNESLEFLVNDMFDISLQDPSDKSDACSVNMKPVGFEESGCSLCELLKKNDFKEEASLLQELYKDLDSLSRAHLEELELNDREFGSDQNEESGLVELLDKLANHFLDEFRDDKRNASLNLFCIELLLKLLPSASKLEFGTRCLKSNNFDTVKVLMSTLQNFNSGPENTRIEPKHLEQLNSMVYSYSIGILESNLTRENMAFVLNFINQTVDSLFHSHKSYAELLKVAKRAEIEIYMNLDDVFRLENAFVSSVAFDTMEKVMTIISEAEAPIHKMDEFFAIFHRSVQLLFDYFDSLYEQSKTGASEKAHSYKVYSLRLLSCWMTLEPMYYQNQFMDKLDRILSLLSEFDFIWLLPTFNHIDLSDLDSVNRFIELLFKLLIRVTNIDTSGEIGDHTTKMVCILVTRLHLDQMIDYEKMLRAINTNAFDYTAKLCSSTNVEKKFDLDEYLGALNEQAGGLREFKPSYPVEFLAPIFASLDQSNTEGYKVLSSVAIEFFLKSIENSKLDFVKKRLEGIYDFEALVTELRADADFEAVENLCYATEATASTCLCRLYESSSTKYIDHHVIVALMELVIYFFVHTSPKYSSDYLDDEHRMIHYFSLCKICIFLMQNYRTFLVLFNYSIKKVCLKIATPPRQEFEIMIEEGFVVEEDLVLSEFFSTYSCNLQ